MMFRLFQIVVLWLTLALAVSCGSDRVAEVADRPLAELPEAREIQAALRRFSINGIDIVFSAEVSRSFRLLPGGILDQQQRWEVGGVGVRGSLVLERTRAVRGRTVPIPDGVAIQRVFVVRGDRVWITTVSIEEDPSIGAHSFIGVGEGPKWDYDLLLDVIAEVMMPDGDHIYVAERELRILGMY